MPAEGAPIRQTHGVLTMKPCWQAAPSTSSNLLKYYILLSAKRRCSALETRALPWFLLSAPPPRCRNIATRVGDTPPGRLQRSWAMFTALGVAEPLMPDHV